MRLLSLLARDVLRAMFVSARVFRATTSSSKSTVSDVTPPHNSPPPVSRTKSGEEGLLEWIEANGASKFRAAILDVAGDLDDLKHITEPDFEDLVKGMPKLKARRLRASLVELGARLA